MKNKINYLEVLEKKQNLKVPPGVDQKAFNAIRLAVDRAPGTFMNVLRLLYRPAFVFGFIALVVCVPLVIIFITISQSGEYPPVYTVMDLPEKKSDLLLEYTGKSSLPGDKDMYKKDVTGVGVRFTSKGVIIQWKNPADRQLKRVVIEKGKKTDTEMTTLFPGNVNFYIDPDYNPGDYYRIRCINEKNLPSRGVFVIPETGEK